MRTKGEFAAAAPMAASGRGEGISAFQVFPKRHEHDVKFVAVRRCSFMSGSTFTPFGCYCINSFEVVRQVDEGQCLACENVGLGLNKISIVDTSSFYSDRIPATGSAKELGTAVRAEFLDLWISCI